MAADRIPCACSLVVAVAADGTTTRTGCTATTRHTFAPGHDARLKGFLIRAGRDGLHVRTVGLGVAHETTAVKFAERFGFAHMVRDGIARPAKVRKAAPKPTTATAKVGRWVYTGQILSAGDGSPVFRYTDRRGQVVETLRFTVQD